MDHEFETSLGYIVRLSEKQKQKNEPCSILDPPVLPITSNIAWNTDQYCHITVCFL
jgi:hypothetical protein